MSEVNPAPKIAVKGNFKGVTVTKKVPKGKVEAGLEGAASALMPFTACSDPVVKEKVVEREVVKEVPVEVCPEIEVGELGSVKQGESAKVEISLPEDNKYEPKDAIVYFEHKAKKDSTLTYSKMEISGQTLIFDVKAGYGEQIGDVSLIVKFIEGGKQVSLRGTLVVEEREIKVKAQKKSGKQGGLEILSVELVEEDNKPLKSKKEL